MQEKKNLLQRRGRDGPSQPPVAWTSTHQTEKSLLLALPRHALLAPAYMNSSFATRTEMVEEEGVNLPKGRARALVRTPARPGSVFGGAARRGREGRGRIGGKSKGSTTSSPPSPKLKVVAQKPSGVSLRININERALQLLEKGGVEVVGWRSGKVHKCRTHGARYRHRLVLHFESARFAS